MRHAIRDATMAELRYRMKLKARALVAELADNVSGPKLGPVTVRLIQGEIYALIDELTGEFREEDDG